MAQNPSLRVPRSAGLLLTLLGVLLLPVYGPVWAMWIADQDLSDDNIITAQFEDDQKNELIVWEDYNEKYLVPYKSHDGYGIVNSQGGYFDKVVTFEDGDIDGLWALDFRVTNTSPYTWSDYHFEFWDASFTQRWADFPLVTTDPNLYPQAEIFQNWSFDGSMLQFWAPGWQSPGQTQQLVFWFDPSKINSGQAGSFGIRQVATTVPEPGTLILLGSGLAAFAVRRRRKAT